jgi:hypothetical protein
MHKVWDVLTSVADGYYRPRAKHFMKLPSRSSLPEYYELIKRPIHLETIRKRIVNEKYKAMEEFEEDVTMLIENSRAYYSRETEQCKDIEILQNVFWESITQIEQDQPVELQETPGVFKQAPPPVKRRSTFSMEEVATDGGEPRELRPVPTEEEYIERVLEDLCEAQKLGIPLVAAFMKVPLKTKPVTESSVFPQPLIDPPTVAAGDCDKLTSGKLPNMAAKGLPSESTLRSWNEASQLAFWAQRRAHWNRMKLSDLQRACRKCEIWPGGDASYIKDRLLRYDFARSLLMPCETRTEAQEQEEIFAAQYHEVTDDPMAIETMRRKLADKEYKSFASFEQDFKHMVWIGETYNGLFGVHFPYTESLVERFEASKRAFTTDMRRLENYNKLVERHNAKLAQAERLAVLGPIPEVEKLEHGLTWKQFGAVYSPWFDGPNSRDIIKMWKTYRQLLKDRKKEAAASKAGSKPDVAMPPLKQQLLRVFKKVNEVKDGERVRSAQFQHLPNRAEPSDASDAAAEVDARRVYYSVVKLPIDMSMIKQKIESEEYESMAAMEKDMMLLFDNARKFDAYTHPETERQVSADADALQAAMKLTIEDTLELLKKMEAAGRKRPRASSAATLQKQDKQDTLTVRHQLAHILAAVCGAKDGDRQLAEEFMHLPKKLAPLEPLPEPLTEVPELPSGKIEMTSFNPQTLPDMTELCSWTRTSQKQFWDYRRSMYQNRMQASELMRECRKRNIYPGGDEINIIDRLLRYDFCRSKLIERETWTEEQHAQAESEVGRVYYEVVSDPIDIATIRSKCETGVYDAAKGGAVAALEADLNKLFTNARTFVSKAGSDSRLNADVDALSSAMRKAVKEMESLVKSVEQNNEAVALQPISSGSEPLGAAGTKRRRSSKDKEEQSSAAMQEEDSKPAKQTALPVPSKPKSVMMLDAWTAVRNVIDEKDGRERAQVFMQLPTVEELPAYYEVIGSPIDLRTVREKIDEGRYRRWDSFERDMMLVFANARQFNMEGSRIYDDAEALEKAFKAQPAPDEVGIQVFDPSVESSKPQSAHDLTKSPGKRKAGGESNGGSSTGEKKRRR